MAKQFCRVGACSSQCGIPCLSSRTRDELSLYKILEGARGALLQSVSHLGFTSIAPGDVIAERCSTRFGPPLALTTNDVDAFFQHSGSSR